MFRNRHTAGRAIAFLAISVVVALAQRASASCWVLVVQSAIGEKAPVIVTGEITKVDISPPSPRCFDVAHLKVEAIHKNVLNDFALKIGDQLPTRIHGKNRFSHSSTDLRYKVGKKATWYLYLEGDKNFYICRHIQQCRPVEEKPVLSFQRVERIRRLDAGTDPDAMTIEKWIAKRNEIEATERRAREEYQARKVMIATLRASLVVDGEFSQERMDVVLAAEESIRRDVLHSTPHAYGFERMDPADWTKMQIAFLERDRVDNIRRLAASKLGYRGVYELARAPLLAALESSDPKLRLFACQSLKQRNDRTAAPAVRKLLGDEHATTRHMAVSTLGVLGDREEIADLVALYEKEPESWEADYHYCIALSRLGEKQLSIKLAARQLADDQHNHYMAAVSLERIDSKKTVPIAMLHLLTELERCLPKLDKRKEEDRIFLALCRVLTKQTQQAHGTNVVQWHAWWANNHENFAAAPLPFDRDLAVRLQKQYDQKKSLKKRSRVGAARQE